MLLLNPPGLTFLSVFGSLKQGYKALVPDTALFIIKSPSDYEHHENVFKLL